jgi:hypothetical protein
MGNEKELELQDREPVSGYSDPSYSKVNTKYYYQAEPTSGISTSPSKTPEEQAVEPHNFFPKRAAESA